MVLLRKLLGVNELSADKKKVHVTIHLLGRRSTTNKHVLKAELANAEPGRETSRTKGELLGTRLITDTSGRPLSQQEKEALDDLSGELELADEDELVM